MPRRVLFVLATDGFRDEELVDLRATLHGLGIETRIAAPQLTRLRGMLGTIAWPDERIDEVGIRPFGAIVVVGGTGAARELWGDPAVIQLLQRAAAEGVLLVGIGLGAVPIAQADLLAGSPATCYPSPHAIAELRRYGARRMAGDIVDAGNGIVTARGPEAAPELGWRIAARLPVEPALSPSELWPRD